MNRLKEYTKKYASNTLDKFTEKLFNSQKPKKMKKKNNHIFLFYDFSLDITGNCTIFFVVAIVSGTQVYMTVSSNQHQVT